jgi:hypothetical protein
MESGGVITVVDSGQANLSVQVLGLAYLNVTLFVHAGACRELAKIPRVQIRMQTTVKYLTIIFE